MSVLAFMNEVLSSFYAQKDKLDNIETEVAKYS